MKKILGISILLSAALAQATPAFAEHPDERPVIDDLSLIDLRSDESALRRNYNYPGYGKHTKDCLVLVMGEATPMEPSEAVKMLLTLIEVRDGRGILFAGENLKGEINTLSPTQMGEHMVFPLVDLGKFVTGIEVRTRSGAPLKQALQEAFGNSHDIVALQLIRGCRVTQ